MGVLAVGILINKCSLLFIINIKASWSFKIIYDKGRQVLTFKS